jgi:hypothetical protein
MLPIPAVVQAVYDGFVLGKGGRHLPHQIVSTATDLTKMIDGVRTLLVYEQDFQSGTLVESELLFTAQDRDGNVWHVGEYPEVYEKGHLIGAPDTWLSGVQGAKAGIDMTPNPHVGQTVVQGFSPRIKFWDCAEVVKAGQHRCLPRACYQDVLVTDEWAPFDPGGGVQRKFLAPGVGTIATSNATTLGAEFVNLTRVAPLCEEALAAIRMAAQREERRAYTVAAGVYESSPPAERTLHAQTC